MSAAAQKSIENNDDLASQLSALVGEFSGEVEQTPVTQAEQTPAETSDAGEQVEQIVLSADNITKLVNVIITVVETDPDDRSVLDNDVENWPTSGIADLINYAVSLESLAVEQVDEHSAEPYRNAAAQAQHEARARLTANDAQQPAKGKAKTKVKTKAKTKAKTKKAGSSTSSSGGTKTEKQPAEPVKVETIAKAPAQLTLREERTQKVPLPDTFYLEVDPDTLPKHKGHQVDPSRPEACTPVMPNLDLYASTGNPYPADSDDTVVTSDKYKPFTKVSHLTFARLKQDGAMYGRDKEIVPEILAAAGVSPSTDARTCVQDTLRDCALYGLCTQYLVNKRTRLFKIEA